jgi:hypothetical protein
MQGVGKDEKPLRLPPFPDIDLNWEGFMFSHLHWIGVKVTNASLDEEIWRVKQVLHHEFCHKGLALAPFSQFRQWEMFEFYGLILKTALEGQKQIRIPLKPAISGNKLQKQWAGIVLLFEASRLVEEVIAVYASLLKSLKEGLISNSERREFAKDYKEKYERYIPSFSTAYNAFDLVANKIGESAATAMMYSVFETPGPSTAFWHIISEMCKINPSVPNGFVWNVPDKDTAYIKNLPRDLEYYFFSEFIDRLDPDGSRFGKKALLDYIATTEEKWRSVAQGLEPEFFKFLLDTHETILYCTYSDFIHPFSKLGEISKEVEYGNYFIFIEAIRQQLTQGIGLLCPFWGYSPDRCCDIKPILEKVWSCTSPTRSCRLWERMGCLAKDGGTH